MKDIDLKLFCGPELKAGKIVKYRGRELRGHTRACRVIRDRPSGTWFFAVASWIAAGVHYALLGSVLTARCLTGASSRKLITWDELRRNVREAVTAF